MVRGTEARKWFKNQHKKIRDRDNDDESSYFAANHFDSLENVEHAVNHLYKVGAVKVNIAGDSDAMFIVLPSGKKKLLAVMEAIVMMQPDEFSIRKNVAKLWWD